MKTNTRQLLTLAVLLGFTAQTWAQSSAVPDQISYQGVVTDAGGTPIGNTTPENRTVVFRIWDHATNTAVGNLIYSEQQVVTISKGEFSVLVGDGTAVTGTPLGYSETAKGKPTVTIPTAFGGTTRFIGVAVYDSGGAVAPEISPRQRVVSSAFAYRAKVAENMNGGTITGAVTATGSTFTGGTFNSGTFTGAVTATGGSFTGTGTGLTSLNASNLASGTVGDARLSSNVALLNRSPQTFSGAINSFSGNVGIGTTTPGERLTVVGTGTTSATSALGVFNSGLGSLFHVRNDGNVGIGTTTPTQKLDVSGNVLVGTGDNSAFVVDSSGFARFGIVKKAGSDPMITAASGSHILFGQSNQSSLFTNIVSSTLTEYMRIQSDGNVGIGTTSPAAKLDVAGKASAFAVQARGSVATHDQGCYLEWNRNGSGESNFVNQKGLGTGGWAWFEVTTGNSYTERMRMDGNGAMGIGTTPNSSRARLTVGSVSTTAGNGTPFPLGRYMDNTSTGSQNQTWGGGTVSIEATANIVCNGVFATSDERIKKVAGQSDGVADLKTLLGIKVTDYVFKDPIANGGQPQKKVIAQQVEKVFPQAVSQGTNTVPDIFKKASIEADWIMLTTDLKKGDRVKLIDEKDAEAIHEVLEVKEDKFRTAFKTEAKNVFVYGREVNDFRRVDYEAISMLNVSATQQIKKEKDAEVKLLKDENTELKAKLAAQDTRLATLEAQTQRLADLEAKDKARDAKLAAIEKLLMSADKAAVQPVSLKKSIGGAE